MDMPKSRPSIHGTKSSKNIQNDVFFKQIKNQKKYKVKDLSVTKNKDAQNIIYKKKTSTEMSSSSDDTDSSEDENINNIRLKSRNFQIQKKVIVKCSNSNGNYYSTILLIFTVSLVLGAIAWKCYESKNSNPKTLAVIFQQSYKKLKAEFPSQHKMSWKVIRSAILSVINSTEPNQPAVILLVATKNADNILSCIANKVAVCVEKTYDNYNDYLKVKLIENTTPSAMKENIYLTFKQSFENKLNHVIVLERLDTFHVESAMVLHSYCDHENAPYKNVVILLTMYSDSSVEKENLSLKTMDAVAFKKLNTVWNTQLDEDKRTALLSRITTSVALIFPEKEVPSDCM